MTCKLLIAITLAIGLLDGCNRKSEAIPNPGAWFIESWANGVITARHQGYRYNAKCDISRSFHNAASITDEHNVYKFQTCDLAVSLVGHTVQPLDGGQRDADGWIVVMWNAGSTLALRSWKDEQTPWKLDEFIIESITKIQD